MMGIVLVLDVWDDLLWGWNTAVLLHNVADAEVDIEPANGPAKDVPFNEERYSKNISMLDS